MPRDRGPRKRDTDDDTAPPLAPVDHDADVRERAADLQRRLTEACLRWTSDHERDRLEKQKPHVTFTSARRMEFLAALEVTGNRQLAADLVGVNVRTPRKHCENDEDFAEDCKIAEDRFRQGVLVASAVRRAVEGLNEPVYQGGQLVGYKRVYSDRLLEQQLKARVPEFRDKVGIEHSGGMSNVTIGLPAAMTTEEYAAFVAGALAPKTAAAPADDEAPPDSSDDPSDSP